MSYGRAMCHGYAITAVVCIVETEMLIMHLRSFKPGRVARTTEHAHPHALVLRAVPL